MFFAYAYAVPKFLYIFLNLIKYGFMLLKMRIIKGFFVTLTTLL
jgi:hypothetical protein